MTTIQAVEPQMYDSLAEFIARSGTPPEPVETVRQWFDLWWDRNPAFEPGMKRGWVCASDGAIGGFIGNLPSRLQLGGKTVTAFSATTWRVLPEFRNQTMGMVFQWLALGKTAPLFGTTPTNDVVKILQTMRFTLLPPADDLAVGVLVLNSKAVLASVTGSGGLSDLAASVVAPAANLVQHFLARKVSASDLSPVRRLCEADGQFDGLWQRTSGRYANTNARTADWINWYCFQPPNAGKLLLGYFPDGVLRGYIVCQPKKHNTMKLLECADLWIEPGFDAALPALIHAVEQDARREGYDMILFPHFTRQLGEDLAGLGLLSREVKAKTNYFKAPAGVAVSENGSYFVAAQGDYGLG